MSARISLYDLSSSSPSGTTSTASPNASRFSLMSNTSSSSASTGQQYPSSSSSSFAAGPSGSVPSSSVAGSTTSGLASALKRTSNLTGGAATSTSSSSQVNILDRNLAKTRGNEVAYGAWAFLFSEIVQYTQRRVSGIAEFEARLSTIGYRVGCRLVELLPLRDSLPPSTSRNATGPPRQTRLLPVLQYVHTTLFKYLFGQPASSLERSNENPDEYMLGIDEPLLDRGVQVPKEMSSLSTNALLAGVVEAVMDGLGFPSRVTSHLVPTDTHPRRTVILIKLEKLVLEREAALGAGK